MAWLFLKLGTIAFGGPAAHTAMMRDEVVRRRGWISDERFVDLIGATNLIPGPNSTELAIHLGYDRGRWRGLLAAGVLLHPAGAVLVAALAWAYVTYGDTPAVEGMLYGIVPAVIAIIAAALVGLLRTVLGRCGSGVLAVAAPGRVSGRGQRAAGPRRRRRPGRRGPPGPPPRPAGRARAARGPLALGSRQPVFPDPTGGQLAQLFVTMMKIGAVLYGSRLRAAGVPAR